MGKRKPAAPRRQDAADRIRAEFHKLETARPPTLAENEQWIASRWKLAEAGRKPFPRPIEFMLRGIKARTAFEMTQRWEAKHRLGLAAANGRG
jgi:hypothetical protein